MRQNKIRIKCEHLLIPDVSLILYYVCKIFQKLFRPIKINKTKKKKDARDRQEENERYKVKANKQTERK